MADKALRKGYMTEALLDANAYVFTILNRHRIIANDLPRNQATGNLPTRHGITVEGYARDFVMINSVWEDHLLTSLTQAGWARL